MNAVCVQSQNEAWKNPKQGYLKLNVDEAFSLKFGGDCGGILRDENDCNMPTDVGQQLFKGFPSFIIKKKEGVFYT